eukprot:jgi/Chlat1/2493/Chrsp175S02368
MEQVSSKASSSYTEAVMGRREPYAPDYKIYEHWVLFSDLHLSMRSLATCKKVLNRVHQLAVERKAGILFLGDFWHEANHLMPIELLHEVVKLLRLWTQPMVMIPGNHDQVYSNEVGSAALMLLEYASDGYIKVLQEPCRFLDGNACFIPYQHDPRAFADAVKKFGIGAKAIFAHVGVETAEANENAQQNFAVKRSVFPASSRTFSGHYHKKHEVKLAIEQSAGTVTYIGSPYEVETVLDITTFREAGQDKSLFILNKDFEVVSEEAICVGPRHHVIRLHDERGVYQPPQKQLANIEKHDLVRLCYKTRDEDVIKVKEELKLKEIVPMEVYETEDQLDAAHLHLEDGSDRVEVFAKYGRSTNMSAEAIKAGQELLKSTPSYNDCSLFQRMGTVVKLCKVELEGFGPFLKKTELQLDDHGIHLVQGSNGAGKTILVMAALWALTGKLDLRLGPSSLAITSVIHPKADSATVWLSGRLQYDTTDEEFEVERCVSKHSNRSNDDDRDKLKYRRNWTYRTGKKDVIQKLIDKELRTALISRIAFHHQHAIKVLLDLGDMELKQVLVCTIDRVWCEARKLRGKKQSKITQEIEELELEINKVLDRQSALEERPNSAVDVSRGQQDVSAANSASLSDAEDATATSRQQESANMLEMLDNHKKATELRQKTAILTAVDKALGPDGIQARIVRAELKHLQACVSEYLKLVSDANIELNLQMESTKIKGKVQVKINGCLVSQTLQQLSGGELRQLAIVMALAYNKYIHERLGFSCNLIVLDQVMQHLDQEGCRRLHGLLVNIQLATEATIFVVAQAPPNDTGLYRSIIPVVNEDGKAGVQIDQPVPTRAVDK